MPTFSYKCDNCGHTFDKFLRIDKHLEPTNCPCDKCGKCAINQVIMVGPLVGDPFSFGEKRRAPQDWRYFLKELKRKNPNSNVSDY